MISHISYETALILTLISLIYICCASAISNAAPSQKCDAAVGDSNSDDRVTPGGAGGGVERRNAAFRALAGYIDSHCGSRATQEDWAEIMCNMIADSNILIGASTISAQVDILILEAIKAVVKKRKAGS